MNAKNFVFARKHVVLSHKQVVTCRTVSDFVSIVTNIINILNQIKI